MEQEDRGDMAESVVPSAHEIDGRAVASKLVAALQRMVPSAKDAGLDKSAEVLAMAIGTIGYEAAGFRIPKCSGCGQPRAEEEAIRKINRDRA